MKDKDLLKKLYEVQKLKSKVKRLIQEAFDTIHQLETTVMLLIEDIQKRGKK